MKEIWKDIKGFEGLYQVSNLGQVRSLNYKNQGGVQILKQSKAPHGYKRITLKKKSFLVHRLVAIAFIPQPEGCTLINHKDENKINNCVSNLEWCNAFYNFHYSEKANQKFINRYTKGFKRDKEYSRESTRKPYKHFYGVEQLDKNGNILNRFANPTDAGRTLGIQVGHIIACIEGKEKSIHGFCFRKIDR